MIIGSDPTSGHLSAGVAYRVFAQAVDDFLHQRNFEAGEKLAMFYKMDAGLAPIELPPVESYPSIEERDYTPINRTRFINEWMTGFLTELGVTDQAKIDQYVNCMFDLGNVTENAFMNYLQHKEDALMGKIALVEGSLAALDSLSRCNEKVDLEYPINLVWKAFASHPPRFVLKVAANFLLEQPTFVQSVINYEVYLSTTKSFLAGKTFATFPKIFLKDLVF